MRWIKAALFGMLGGLVAALLMTTTMLILRYVFGMPIPAELLGDRIAPTMPVNEFLSLMARIGGYNKLKMFGVRSVLQGQLGVGLGFGLLYGLLTEWARGRSSDPDRPRTPRPSVLLVVAAGVLAWLVSIVGFWPVLDTNFRGFPTVWAVLATMLGLAVSYGVFGASMVALYGWSTSRRSLSASATDGQRIGRRAALTLGVGVAAGIVGGGLLRRLYTLATFSYDGLRLRGTVVTPITPNDQFYCVTKNVVDPSVWKPVWGLRIDGLVENSRTYDFDEIAAMPSIDQETTLMCISNGVGDGLISNAKWRGVPLRDLIGQAGPQDGVVEALLHGADGYSDSVAIEKALETTTLVVYEMNGEPLPERHGYPVRLIVPGLFGEKNIKWVTRVELVDHDAKGFYEQQGWGPSFVVPVRSRFFGPDRSKPFPIGQPITFTGIAFAGNRGISKVEVSTDDGRTWSEATIDYRGGPTTWVLWSHEFSPEEAGDRRAVVRATDGAGEAQITRYRGIVPGGSTGLHRVPYVVSA